jgi:hypothetical protein
VRAPPHHAQRKPNTTEFRQSPDQENAGNQPQIPSRAGAEIEHAPAPAGDEHSAIRRALPLVKQADDLAEHGKRPDE